MGLGAGALLGGAAYLTHYSVLVLLGAGALTIGAGAAAAWAVGRMGGSDTAMHDAASWSGRLIGIFNGLVLMVVMFGAASSPEFQLGLKHSINHDAAGQADALTAAALAFCAIFFLIALPMVSTVLAVWGGAIYQDNRPSANRAADLVSRTQW